MLNTRLLVINEYLLPVNDPPESIEVSPVYPAEGAGIAIPLTNFFSDRDDDVSSMQVFLEVEGAGYYLPKYAGNLDIITSAAMGTAEELIKLSS